MAGQARTQENEADDHTLFMVKKQERMRVSAQLTLTKFRIPSYSGILSPIKISLLTLVNKIKIIP